MENRLPPALETPPYSNSFYESLRKQIVKAFDYSGNDLRIITPESHPAFHAHLAELSDKAGLSYVPTFIATRHNPMPGPAWVKATPFGGAVPPAILVNDTLLGLCEISSDAQQLRAFKANPSSLLRIANESLKKRMNPALETVVAHELSHVRDGYLGGTIGSRLPVLAMPLAALAGYRLYLRAHDKAKKDDAASLAQHVKDGVEEEVAQAHAGAKEHANTPHPDPKWTEGLIRMGGDVAAVAAGLGTGLITTRHLSLASEYRADRMAVELTGKPNEFKDVLSNMTACTYEIARLHHKQQPKKLPKTLMDHVKREIWMTLEETVHAHPSLKERFSHIDKVALERGISAAEETITHLR